MTNRQAERASLRIDTVAIVRGNRLVLRDFSLGIEAGEIVWLRGANGTGKSTLLRAVAGLLDVSAGKIESSGRIALTDDRTALDSDRSLDEALRFWTQLDGVPGTDLEAALEALDLVRLAELPVRLLSAGQKRRGALARTISCGADIWLLDEPYNGLDDASLARLDTAIGRHAAGGGIVIVASHIAPSVNVARSISLDRIERKAA